MELINLLVIIKITTPIFGILENMSGLTCPNCGTKIELFKSGGGDKAVRELGVPFLGRIPLDLHIVDSTDNGKPFVELYPDAESAQLLMNICKSIDERERPQNKG